MAWQGATAEPRASAMHHSTSDGGGDGGDAGRNFALHSVRIERTLQFDKHAEYEIVTTYEAADGSGGVQESLVSRRYSEFRKLEKAISDVIEGLPVRASLSQLQEMERVLALRHVLCAVPVCSYGHGLCCRPYRAVIYSCSAMPCRG